MEKAKCGLCVEPEAPRSIADAILHYYRNPRAASTAGTNARRFVETEFDPTALAENYLAALARALGKDGSPTIAAANLERPQHNEETI
jgi:glycosyltransferase involved in cell wall biosynthesis